MNIKKGLLGYAVFAAIAGFLLVSVAPAGNDSTGHGLLRIHAGGPLATEDRLLLLEPGGPARAPWLDPAREGYPGRIDEPHAQHGRNAAGDRDRTAGRDSGDAADRSGGIITGDRWHYDREVHTGYRTIMI